MTTLQRTLGALSTLMMFALVGCTEADPVASTPSASATIEEPTPSASPSALESTEPETAKEFIRRWVSLQNDMQVTGETSAYMSVSEDCDSCSALARRIEAIYSSGGSVQTTGWTLEKFQRHRLLKPMRYVEFDVTVFSAETDFRETAGSPQQRLSGGTTRHHLILERRRGEWAVTELSQYPA